MCSSDLLETLDPFSSYLSADQYKQYQKSIGSAKGSLGLVMSKRAGLISIVDAVPGSPAAKANLGTGDFIESINGVSTRDMPLAFADMLLQGDVGTSVEMSVLRFRKPEPQKIALIRQAVPVPPVTGKLVNEGDAKNVGVITAMGLPSGRSKDIAARIAELEKQGAKSLILDLRHSSTGAPEEGIAVANLFVEKGLLGYSVGQKSARQDYQAAGKPVTKLPLVVLTNRSTVGAAEIAAAALLSRDRAKVVGERTYGDAAVRKPVTLDDGSAVILATAKFYTPEGKTITFREQEGGVTPTQAVLDDASAEEDNLPEGVDPATLPTKAKTTDDIDRKSTRLNSSH